MKKSTIIILVVIGLIAMLGIKACNVTNTCVGYETDIEKANEGGVGNIRSRIDQVIPGNAAAAERYTDKVIEAFRVANEGRYGEDGSKAAVQVFVEQNPNISPELYAKLQQVIESQWADFANEQKSAMDKAYNYKKYLRTIPNGFIAGIFGYPKIDMAKYEKAILTKDARKAVETREDEVLDPFEKKK
jgi:hypothetical protein